VTDKEKPSVTVGKKGKTRRVKDQPANESGTPAPGDKDSDGGNNDTRENSDEFEPDDWGNSDDDKEIMQDGGDLLPNRMATLTMNADLEKTVDERLDMFYNYLLAQKQKSSTLDPKLVVNEAERLDVKDKAVLLLCRVLFDADPAKMHSNIKPNRTLLLRFTLNNKKGQQYLLGGFETLVVAHKNILLPKVSLILKSFYDEDIIDERVLLEWGDKLSKKYVSKEDNKEIRSKAEPFLKWLREAEEESEDGSDDEENGGVEVAFEEEGRGKKPTPTPAAPKQNGTTTIGGENKKEKDDDFNIDDI